MCVRVIITCARQLSFKSTAPHFYSAPLHTRNDGCGSWSNSRVLEHGLLPRVRCVLLCLTSPLLLCGPGRFTTPRFNAKLMLSHNVYEPKCFMYIPRMGGTPLGFSSDVDSLMIRGPGTSLDYRHWQQQQRCQWSATAHRMYGNKTRKRRKSGFQSGNATPTLTSELTRARLAGPAGGGLASLCSATASYSVHSASGRIRVREARAVSTTPV